MDRSSLKVLSLLNSLTTPSLDSFNERLVLQKLTYLGREVGLDSGFSFSWYVHGPYSPSLARLLYSMHDVGLLSRKWKLESNEEKEVTTAEKRLRQLLGDDLADPRALELIASTWYAIPPGLKIEGGKEETINYLHDIKPKYTRAEYAAALERVLRFRESLPRRV